MALFSSTQNTAALSGGFEVQADDIGGLLCEFRLGTSHIAAQSMGLDPRPSPHPSHPAVGNPQMPGQLSGAPMSRTIGRRLLSRLQNPRLLADDSLHDNLASILGIQTRQMFFHQTNF